MKNVKKLFVNLPKEDSSHSTENQRLRAFSILSILELGFKTMDGTPPIKSWKSLADCPFTSRVILKSRVWSLCAVPFNSSIPRGSLKQNQMTNTVAFPSVTLAAVTLILPRSLKTFSSFNLCASIELLVSFKDKVILSSR